MNTSSRRAFLRSAVGSGGLAACHRLGSGLGLPPVSAVEAKVGPAVVRLHPGIEPLVRLLEEAPRERLVEEVAARIRKGATYRQVLAALLLAGVRNVQPRPSVGFKFHAVLVVQSLHLTSLASAEADRWLPVFWGLDYFKHAQAQDVREGDWTMGPVKESDLPSRVEAAETFQRAMDGWDEAAADAAVAGLARAAKPEAVFDLLFRYGARDFRSIGHKAIFAANAHRTLGVIGWEHAEPVLRSLAYAMLQHEGDNPAGRDAPADVAGRRNRELSSKIRQDWLSGRPDPAATAKLLSVLRDGSERDASEQVVELINRGTALASIWDALFAGAAELLLRQPGIVALHAVTTTNALRYAWQHSRDDATRRFVVLQNAAFLPMFREAMRGRGQVMDRRIDALPAAAPPDGRSGVEEILAEVTRDPMSAVGKVLGYLGSGGEADALVNAARRVLLAKGDDAHDYKFSEAVFEDFRVLAPAWRDRFLAVSTLRLHGSQDRDNPLVERVREAFV